MKRLTAMVSILCFMALAARSGSTAAQNPEMVAHMAGAAKTAYQKLLAEMDKNHDGKISKAEFLPIYKDKDKAEKNYKAWDLNEDGFITEEEYVKAITNLAKPKRQ